MQVTKKQLTPTSVRLTIVADDTFLATAKQTALTKLSGDVKVQGFRQGHAPAAIVEKHIQPTALQAEFLDIAVNDLYVQAANQERLRPVDRPKVTIKKFVPFDTLEMEAEVAVVGDVKLPDYKKIKLAKPKVVVEAKEVDEVIKQLMTRDAEKKDVKRASKNGDQVWIDFTGVDAKTKEPIKGADGKNYPLALGSKTFIPGFEDNLVGVKPGDSKEFTLTFPKDYGAKALQNRKVTFNCTVKKVQEVVDPKLDDAFAAKVGPFKSVQELKDDIKKELLARKEADAAQKYADELITKITEKSTIAIPDVLVDEQVERIEKEERQNLMYRGQTWQEFLESQGLDEAGYRQKARTGAELRVKAGLVLAEIAEAEKIDVTEEELKAQLQILKARYTDKQMQAELDKPQNQRDILSRMVTQKTITKLTEYAS